MNDPQILFADEPTGALDRELANQIMDILKEVARDRLVVVITHDKRYVRGLMKFCLPKMGRYRLFHHKQYQQNKR